MNGYRLVRRAPGAQRPGGLEHGPDGARDRAGPRLDDAQQRVVDHQGGPLLVLAGPGTGKTTTIVEAVAERIERRGADPERILVLTFSRKAAAELRDRITARLGRTTSEPLALTFHSYAYALVRREFVLAGDQPPRLLSAPEQLLEIRRLLRGEIADGAPELAGAAVARARHQGLRRGTARRADAAAERGLDGKALRRLGRAAKRDDWAAAGDFLDRYAARFDLAPVPAYDYAEIVRIAAALSRAATRQPRARRLRRDLRRRVPGQRPGAGVPAAGPGGRWPGPDRRRRPGPVDLRVPRRGRAGAGQLPREVPRPGR